MKPVNCQVSIKFIIQIYWCAAVVVVSRYYSNGFVVVVVIVTNVVQL
jgi:hypothetical protein